QADDGMRAFHVNGVQTCALPICVSDDVLRHRGDNGDLLGVDEHVVPLHVSGLLEPLAVVVASLTVHEVSSGQSGQHRQATLRAGHVREATRQPHYGRSLGRLLDDFVGGVLGNQPTGRVRTALDIGPPSQLVKSHGAYLSPAARRIREFMSCFLSAGTPRPWPRSGNTWVALSSGAI